MFSKVVLTVQPPGIGKNMHVTKNIEQGEKVRGLDQYRTKGSRCEASPQSNVKLSLRPQEADKGISKDGTSNKNATHQSERWHDSASWLKLKQKP